MKISVTVLRSLVLRAPSPKYLPQGFRRKSKVSQAVDSKSSKGLNENVSYILEFL